MKSREFPFAKYRDWAGKPSEEVELNIDGLLRVADWQSRSHKKPMFDDITGYYGFFPSEEGANTYVKKAARDNPALQEQGDRPGDLKARQERQEIHIAETAELASALFWTAAVVRSAVLADTVANVERGRPLSDDGIIYAADAISDYGYCLANPVSIVHDGKGFRNYGQGLKDKIDGIAPGIGLELERFGSHAHDYPEELFTYEGVAALETTLAEQERRIGYWQPRHESMTAAFPSVEISEEILLHRVPLKEMLSIQPTLQGVK